MVYQTFGEIKIVMATEHPFITKYYPHHTKNNEDEWEIFFHTTKVGLNIHLAAGHPLAVRSVLK
jgi:hypothetical protein